MCTKVSVIQLIFSKLILKFDEFICYCIKQDHYCNSEIKTSLIYLMSYWNTDNNIQYKCYTIISLINYLGMFVCNQLSLLWNPQNQITIVVAQYVAVCGLNPDQVWQKLGNV